MEEHERNPAGRLWLFLTHAKAKASHRVVTLNVWASYLDVEPEANAAFLRRAAAILELPDQVRAAVAGLSAPPLPVEHLLGGLPEVESAFTNFLSFNTQSADFAGHISDTSLVKLEACSHILNSSGVASADISPDNVERIRELATAFLASIEDADGLDSGVRRVLFEYASAIVRAMGLLKVAGAGAVLLEYDRFIGRAVRDSRVRVTLSRFPDISSAIVKLGVVITAAISVKNGAIEIAAGINDILALTQAPSANIAPAGILEDSAA